MLDQAVISKELVKFNDGLPGTLADVIEGAKVVGLTLKIDGINDKTGYMAVHNARMGMVKLRRKIEEKRKELKEDSLAYGRAIDAEAKKFFDMLEPVEKYLLEQETAIDNEKERIRKAKEEEKMEAMRKQVEAENAQKLAEANAKIEALRLEHEEAAKKLAADKALFERQKRQYINGLPAIDELEKKVEAIDPKTLRDSMSSKEFEDACLAKPPVDMAEGIRQASTRKADLLGKFFEACDESNVNHVNAPVEVKHYLYGSRYIERDAFDKKDIVEYILDEVCK